MVDGSWVEQCDLRRARRRLEIGLQFGDACGSGASCHPRTPSEHLLRDDLGRQNPSKLLGRDRSEGLLSICGIVPLVHFGALEPTSANCCPVPVIVYTAKNCKRKLHTKAQLSPVGLREASSHGRKASPSSVQGRGFGMSYKKSARRPDKLALGCRRLRQLLGEGSECDRVGDILGE